MRKPLPGRGAAVAAALALATSAAAPARSLDAAPASFASAAGVTGGGVDGASLAAAPALVASAAGADAGSPAGAPALVASAAGADAAEGNAGSPAGAPAAAGEAVASSRTLPSSPSPPAFCRVPDPEPPPYYAFEMVPTGRVPGTGRAKASGEVLFAPSPFGVALAADGSYLLDVRLRFEGLRAPGAGAYVAWVTTPTLDRVERVGALSGDGVVTARVAWNKFLVVVTLEPSDDPSAEAWTGPVILRGMSRSGMMHTMAGHGPFQQENCARYGYQQD